MNQDDYNKFMDRLMIPAVMILWGFVAAMILEHFLRMPL